MIVEEQKQLTELLDLTPDRVDIVANPAVKSARRFLLVKETPKEEANMTEKFVEDLDDILERLEKSEGDDREAIKKEMADLIVDLKDAVTDPEVEIKKEEVESVIAKLEKATKKNVTKEDLEKFISEIREAMQKRAEEVEAWSKADLSDADKKKIKDVLAKLWPLKGKIPDSIFTALGSLVGYPKPEGYPAPAGGVKKSEFSLAKEEIEKSDLPDDLKQHFLDLLDKEHEVITKAEQEREKALLEQIQKAEQEAAEAKELIAKMQAERERMEWVEKAKQYSHLPISPEEAADLLMKSPEPEKLEALFKATDEQLKQAGFFKEIGSAIPDEDSAEGKVEAMAKEMVEKGEAENLVVARAKIWKSHPELRRQLREEE